MRCNFEIAKRLDPDIFEIYTFCKEGKVGDLPKNIIPIITREGGAFRNFSVLPRMLDKKVNIVQTIGGSPSDFILSSLCKIKDPRIKQVVHTTFSTSRVDGGTLWNYLSGISMYKEADVIVAVSDYVKRSLKKYHSIESQVIYNGVDTEFFHPEPHHNERIRVLYVGRLQYFKRPLYITKLAKDFPQLDFSIYGDGPLKPKLEGVSHNLKNFTIHSFTPHEKLKHVYSNSDIFLFPSIFEGFSCSMLEAAASGLPIIASNAASMPEFIEHGREGFLFRNYEQAKKFLSYLIDDENTRKDFSNHARIKSLKFDWKVIATQYSNLYKRLVEEA